MRDYPLMDIPLIAGEDLDDKQFYGVGLDDTGKLVLADGSEEITLGILQNKPQSGEPASVRREGFSKAISGGSTTIGMPQIFSSGKVTDVTTKGDRYNCIAMESGADDGQVVQVLMEHGFYSTAI